MKSKFNSYLEQIRSGKLNSRKLIIIQELSNGNKTLEYFRNVLKIPHQSITSAMSVLCDEGVVRVINTNANDKFSIFQLVEDENEQLKLIQQRNLEKKELFISRGMKEGFIGYDENNKLVIL